MTAHLAHSTGKLSDFITTLSRLSASKLASSLLSLIQSSASGVIVMDAARQIVLINHKAERIFGYPAKELLEKPIEVLMPPLGDNEHRRRMDRLVPTRFHARRSKLELKGLRADGEPLAIRASITRISVQGELFLALVLHDSPSRYCITRAGNAPPMRPAELRRWAVSSHQANEVEKRRFSKKLYDDIGQRLSVLKLDLDWLESSLPNVDAELPSRVAQMQRLLDNVIAMTKNMASALRPPLLDDFGLLPAVEWMADNLQKKTSIQCRVESNGLSAKLHEPVESAVFRVIQEGLSNIERHANASTAKITLLHTGNYLDVMIRDDGTGLAPGSKNKPGCYGLIAMQERIYVLGGTITIQNAEPRGVAIYVSIPVEPIFCSESISHSPTKHL